MSKFYLNVFICFSIVIFSSYSWSVSVENALNNNSLSSPWHGSVKWTQGSLPSDISMSSMPSNNGKLSVKIIIGQNKCFIEAQEIQRYKNGALALNPLNDTCNLGLKVISTVPLEQSRIGLNFMSGIALLATAELTPSQSGQKLTGQELRPRLALPKSLSGYYFVTASGAVYEISSSGEQITYKVMLLDQWMQDGGFQIGDIYAKGRYLNLLGEVTLSERIIVLPDLREAYKHCGAMYVRPDTYNIVAFKDEQTSESKTIIYSIKPKNKNYCSKPRTSRASCRVVGCDEYTPYTDKKSLLLSNKKMALKLGKASRATYKSTTTYAEALSKLKSNNYGTTVKQGNPGYFDRGGACGSLSCEEENTLQFVVDEYW